jgi:hypothetical protein
VSAIEVQILLALVVPHLAAFALDDVHVEERIYVKQFHFYLCFFAFFFSIQIIGCKITAKK